jgi:hypothetical protein
MNNKYKITIEAPLLRAGIKIETECSEKYVAKVTEKLMEIVREINTPTPTPPTPPANGVISRPSA